jgi:diguanylate cyclase (GGDEF)-like protein/PAS domain S-box-containing protein
MKIVQDPTTPRLGLVGWLLLGNLLVALTLAALAALSLKTSRDAFRERAQIATVNLAESLAITVAARLTQVDMVLQTVARNIGSGTRGPALDRLLAQQLALLPQLGGLRVVDARGVPLAIGPGRDEDRADLDADGAFQHLRDDPQAGVFVGAPVRDLRRQTWVLGVARRLHDGRGGFAGIVQAHVPVAQFQQLISGVNLGAQGAVTLRSSGMQLIARHASQGSAPVAVGTSGVSRELRQAIAADPVRGTFIARTALDGIERTSTYQRLAGYPLLVLVGIGTDEYLGPWHTQRVQVAGLVVFVVLLVAGSSALLYRAWRREILAARRLLMESDRNQALFRTASDGIHVLDREGRIVELSESFAQMLGRGRTDLLGAHVSSWDAEMAPQAIAAWLRGFAPGQTRKFETRHRRADGALIEVEVNCADVHIDDRDLIYCSARDITERKMLQAQLARSASQIEDLYDNAPCGYHSLDAQGRFLHVNATELGWLGCTRDEVLGGGLQIGEFLTPQGRELFRRNFPSVVAGGRVDGLELELLPRNGVRRWVSVSASAVMDEAGRFLRSRSVLYDLTELQGARRRLQDALHEQQAMLDNDLVGILKSCRQTTVWKNQAVDLIFGHQPGELPPPSLRTLFPDEQAYQDFVAEAYPTLEAGGRYRQQLPMLRRDGRRIWLDVSGVLLSAERQESLWLLSDITAIKHSQQQAEHLAFHDPLTGLPNRLLLSDRLAQALALAERHAHRLAVCYLDLDGFKQVNDRLGHAAGDALLREVGRRLQDCVRANDTVCRLGGDEFVLLLGAQEGQEELGTVLERVCAEVARPVLTGRHADVRVSASIGVASFPTDGRLGELLLSRADSAMYQAKKQGRHRVCHYEQVEDAVTAAGAVGARASP